jgi:hypothetical protein
MWKKANCWQKNKARSPPDRTRNNPGTVFSFQGKTPACGQFLCRKTGPDSIMIQPSCRKFRIRKTG